MAIDLTKEAGLNPTQLAKLIPSPRTGHASHSSKVVRWITNGVLVNGQRVKLEALRMGGQWVSTAGALHEFGERLAAGKCDGPAMPLPASTSKRRREVERAERTLEHIGI